jgi:hypothetical protein
MSVQDKLACDLWLAMDELRAVLERADSPMQLIEHEGWAEPVDADVIRWWLWRRQAN